MRIYELDRAGGTLAKAFTAARALDLPRTGVHCSTIVNDILRTLEPRKYAREMAAETRLAFQEVGNVVEDVIAAGLVARIPGWVKPKPRQSRHGIWCSPDGYTLSTRTITEIKATWVSDRGFTDSMKLEGYLLQSLTYAEVWEAERVRLLVLFINGAYPRGAPFPVPREFVVRVTVAERRQWYDRVVQHGRDMGLLVA